MLEVFGDIINLAVMGIGFVIAWILKDLKSKATQKELDEVKIELKELKTKVYDTLKDLVTKEDIVRLDAKLDRLMERQIDRKNS